MESTAVKDNIVFLNRRVPEKNLKNIEESIQVSVNMRADLIEDITDLMMEMIVVTLSNQIGELGGSEMEIKDLRFLEGALQSILCRHYGLPHALHNLPENILDVEELEKE